MPKKNSYIFIRNYFKRKLLKLGIRAAVHRPTHTVAVDVVSARPRPEYAVPTVPSLLPSSVEWILMSHWLITFLIEFLILVSASARPHQPSQHHSSLPWWVSQTTMDECFNCNAKLKIRWIIICSSYATFFRCGRCTAGPLHQKERKKSRRPSSNHYDFRFYTSIPVALIPFTIFAITMRATTAIKIRTQPNENNKFHFHKQLSSRRKEHGRRREMDR